MKICVLAEPDHWHYLDLKRAAGEWHQIECHSFKSLSDSVNSEPDETQMTWSEFDVILARAMPAGSLEQIVFRMDVLLTLQRLGTKIVNPPRAIEASVDKYLALQLLQFDGIPVPTTRVSQTLEVAMEQFRKFDGDVVCKPLFGSMGNGLVRLNTEQEARAYFIAQLAEGKVLYQQAFVDHGGRDLRLLVIGDRVFGMQRTHDASWITNIAQGGVGSSHEPTSTECDLARRASRAVGAWIAGVDLIYERTTGQPYVLEVNSSPSWRTMSQVLEVDIAAEVLGWLESG